MKYTQATVGRLVWLHDGKSTKSRRSERVYRVVVAPKDKNDTACIEAHHYGGNVYNVLPQRLSPANQ